MPLWLSPTIYAYDAYDGHDDYDVYDAYYGRDGVLCYEKKTCDTGSYAMSAMFNV